MTADFRLNHEFLGKEGNVAKDLKELYLNRIADMSVESLVEPSEPGFPVVKRVFDLLQDLNSCDLSELPFEVLIECRERASEALNEFNLLQQTKGQISASRNQALQRLVSQWRQTWEQIVPVVTGSARGQRLSQLLADIDSRLAVSWQLLEQASEKLDANDEWLKQKTAEFAENKRNVDAAIAELQKLKTDMGVAHHAERFKEEAAKREKSSKVWLGWAIVLGVVLVVTAAFILPQLILDLPRDLPVRHVVAYSFAQTVTIAMLTLGALFCARNYAACKHNETVNLHRQNALSTFEIFRSGTDDPATKDAVLTQAVQAIFAPQSSGYLKTANEGHSASPIIEVIRNTVGDLSKS